MEGSLLLLINWLKMEFREWENRLEGGIWTMSTLYFPSINRDRDGIYVNREVSHFLTKPVFNSKAGSKKREDLKTRTQNKRDCKG